MAGRGTTLQVTLKTVAFLHKRGARSHRGGSEFCRSAVLNRAVHSLDFLLDRSDPRKTGHLPDDLCRLAVRLLAAPWALTAFEVQHLGTFLARSPALAAAAAEAGIEPAAFLAALDALTLAEKFALVDLAAQEHGPAAGAAETIGSAARSQP
jgi:hypothetical protein